MPISPIVTWQRDKPLVEKGWVTLQQGDVDRLGLQAQQAAVGVAQSNIAAQQAQLSVLRQQKDYQSVVAPFDGVITQRNIDVGSLVQADATSGTFMFTIMQRQCHPHSGLCAAGRGVRIGARASRRTFGCPKSPAGPSRAR